jgi:hypothetical protein
MQRVFLLLFLVLFSGVVQAQHTSPAIKADISGLLYITTFQQDSLVPTKRRGKIGAITELMANAYVDLPLRNPRIVLRTGLGYSRKEMVLNKYSLGDVLFSILTLSGRSADSFRLLRIRFQYDYLNLPAGIFWRLTRNSHNWFQAQAGLQLNVGFRIHENLVLQSDPSFARLSPAEEVQVRSGYRSGTASIVVGLQPRLDLSARIYKNLGILYSIQVYTLQMNSFHQRVARGGAGLGSGVGVYLNF